MENNLQVEEKGEPAIFNFKGDVEGGFLLAPVNGEEARSEGKNDVCISEQAEFTWEHYQREAAAQ